MLTEAELTTLKFPIGPFIAPPTISDEDYKAMIETIEQAPAKYRKLASTLKDEDLKKTYRDGAWNVQQLFNHVADMQLLHFFRMKKALTENDYKEITLVNIDGWVATADGTASDIHDSLLMFEGIAKRFVTLIRSLTDEQMKIAYYHPIRKTTLDQRQAVAMSAWHVKHHYRHLEIALGR